MARGNGNLTAPSHPSWMIAPQGGGGDGLEARIAKLEATVSHIENDIKEIKLDVREIRNNAQTDFRIIFGALIAVAIGLAGLMAHGFKWI
jgi:hypothetical protein